MRKEKEKAEKEAEAMRQKCAKLEAGQRTACGEPSSLTTPADDQSHPSPELKLKLADLVKRERKLKEYLHDCGEDEVFSGRLAEVQSEMAEVRTKMQLGKDPAAIVK